MKKENEMNPEQMTDVSGGASDPNDKRVSSANSVTYEYHWCGGKCQAESLFMMLYGRRGTCMVCNWTLNL